MRTHFGGRTLARSQALQLLFQAEANSRAVLSVLDGAYALSDDAPLDDYARTLALGVDERRPELDAVISLRSTGWSISRMNGVDRNLLRIALYEMLFVDEVDKAVAIDECVELAKAFGTDESSRFVNGLLGRVADDMDDGVDVVAVAREAARARAAEAERDAEAEAAAEASPEGERDAEAVEAEMNVEADGADGADVPAAGGADGADDGATDPDADDDAAEPDAEGAPTAGAVPAAEPAEAAE